MAFGMSEEELNFSDELTFKDKEVVKFLITDVHENAQSHNVTLKVTTMSGDHNGKATSVFVSAKDNAAAKKRKAQFAKCFMDTGTWKREDLIAGRAELKALIGHVVTVRSSCRPGTGDDKRVFQNWEEFKDEGVQVGAVPPAAQGAPQAQAAAQATSF